MNKLLFIVFLLLSAILSTCAWADQIVMKNGDRVTGSIVKKTGKDLVIKTDHFGVVTTSWDQVESVTADKPVNVVLPDGQTVQGTLATRDGQVEVAAKDKTVNLKLAEVGTLRDTAEEAAYQRLVHPGWTDLWAGTATIGFAGATGNARTGTFTTGFNASRVTRTDKTTVYFNAIKSSALVNGTKSGTAQAVRGGVGYDHNIGGRFFFDTFNDYEYDRFQNLDLRFVIGGGLGFHVHKSERSQFDLVAGGDYNHSKFNTPLVRNSGEFYWGDDYHLKLTGASSLVQSYRMFNDLTDTGTYRINFDTGLSTKLFKWLTWNLSLSDRYLNHPAPGRKTNDLLYTTGVGISFAR